MQPKSNTQEFRKAEFRKNTFTLPDKVLTSLPTGAVKEAVEQLGRRIAVGDYETGSVFPREDKLVEEFGVSRTVIREAIKVLSGKGLIRTARRYGSRVCAFDEWNLLDPDVIRWHDPASPQASRLHAEATELRLLFEPEAAAKAALNANEQQLSTIMSAALHLQPEEDDKALIGADYAFHATILRASGSMMLSQLENLVYAVLIFSYAGGRDSEMEQQLLLRNHVSVAEALIKRDPELARQRMRAMLELAKRTSRAEEVEPIS